MHGGPLIKTIYEQEGALGLDSGSRETYNIRVNSRAWEHWRFVLRQNHHSHRSLVAAQSPRKALGSAPDRNISLLWSRAV